MIPTIFNLRKQQELRMAIVFLVLWLCWYNASSDVLCQETQSSTQVNEEIASRQDVEKQTGESKNSQRIDSLQLAPPIHGAELVAQAKQAYQRGFEYLLTVQNPDGSFGSFNPKMAALKDFGFPTAARGSNEAVLNACTAIIAKALLRKNDRTSAEQAALDKSIDLLLQTERFAYEPSLSFNTWGYGYKLDFLCDLLESPRGPDLKERIAMAARTCIDGLHRFQQADGGWHYYASPIRDGKSMSFNTANIAESLYRARNLGLDVPQGIENDAVKLLNRMMTVKGSAVYDARYILETRAVNEVGTAARTSAVTFAMVMMKHWEQSHLQRCMEIFDEGENWLEQGRKLIEPHSAVHAISGYFFFYGYFYFSECCVLFGEQVPHERWERTAWTMIRTQEADGSWWDTPAAEYGDKWATGFALLVLHRFLEHSENK